MLTFQKQHERSVKLEGCGEGKGTGEGILGKGARSRARKPSGLPFLLAPRARSFTGHRSLPRSAEGTRAGARFCRAGTAINNRHGSREGFKRAGDFVLLFGHRVLSSTKTSHGGPM